MFFTIPYPPITVEGTTRTTSLLHGRARAVKHKRQVRINMIYQAIVNFISIENKDRNEHERIALPEEITPCRKF